MDLNKYDTIPLAYYFCYFLVVRLCRRQGRCVACKPFAFFAIKFAFVTLIFIAAEIGFWISRKKDKARALIPRDRLNDPSLQTSFIFVLTHGIYVGSAFFAMANGLGAALSAFFVSTQPFLTRALAIFMFNEKPQTINGSAFLLALRALLLWYRHQLE